jgi:hypothetical protein
VPGQSPLRLNLRATSPARCAPTLIPAKGRNAVRPAGQRDPAQPLRRETLKRSPTGRATTSRSDAHRPETLKRSPTRTRLSRLRQNATAAGARRRSRGRRGRWRPTFLRFAGREGPDRDLVERRHRSTFRRFTARGLTGFGLAGGAFESSRATAAKPRFHSGSGVLTPFGYEGWKKTGLMEADDGVVA